MSAITPEVPERAPEARLWDELRGGLDDVKRLAVMEGNFAKAEVMVAIKRAAIAVGLVVASLLFLYAAFIYIIAVIAEALGAFNHWWGLGITVLVLLLIAGVLALVAFRIAMRAKNEVTSTIQTIKGDVEWLRQLAQSKNEP